MNVFNKIQLNTQAMNNFFDSSQLSDFINIKNIPTASEKETIDFLQRFPSFRFLLSGQYFYTRNYGEKTTYIQIYLLKMLQRKK